LKTIEQKLIEAKYRPAGFDYLRFILALAVIVWHSIVVSYGAEIELVVGFGPLRPFMFSVLPMFFCLSGFLVAGSLVRNTLIAFLTLRIIRIFPALAVDTLVSALIVGTIATSLPFKEYFSDPDIYQYFLNTLGIIQYDLPGVFENNPLPKMVNQQLWTIPYELECYIVLAVASYFGLVRRPTLFLLCLTIFTVGQFFAEYYMEQNGGGIRILSSGRGLLLSFLWGVAMFLFRKSIPMSALIAAFCAVLIYTSVYSRAGMIFSVVPASYICVYFGVQNRMSSKIRSLANYSYGLFLYGFPLQQLYSWIFVDHREWYFNSAFTIASALVLAAISWHLVEWPIMKNRSTFISFVEKRLKPRKMRLPNR